MTNTDVTAGSGLRGVPLAITPLTRKDVVSDAEVRWCPGCGDYAVLATFQGVLPERYPAREARPGRWRARRSRRSRGTSAPPRR